MCKILTCDMQMIFLDSCSFYNFSSHRWEMDFVANIFADTFFQN